MEGRRERGKKKEETLKGSSRIPESKLFSPSAELEKIYFWGAVFVQY